MGADKATLIAPRVVSALSFLGQTTVLGRTPIQGCAFLADLADFQGPVACLRRFEPSRDWIFVASCDLLLLRDAVVRALHDTVGDFDAAIPMIDDFPQYLCGLYRAESFEVLRENPDWVRMSDWINKLDVKWLTESDLNQLQIDPRWCKGANTPQELTELEHAIENEAETRP